MDGITEIAPDVMRELTREFILNKDVNDRVSIRLRMKAILDFLSTDTNFPPNPLKEEPKPGSARQAAIAINGDGGIPFVAQTPDVQTTAPRRLDNGDILG